MKLFIALLAPMLLSIVACGGDSTGSSSDPVSVARIRVGERVDGQCVFGDDLSQYPVTYSGIGKKCLQAVAIGPLTLDELDQMKREQPSFWRNSSPYRQALIGEWIDGECDFSIPAVQAYLAFSETVSTDWINCVMIVDVGPATENQISKLQGLGAVSSETAVPASPVPGQ